MDQVPQLVKGRVSPHLLYVIVIALLVYGWLSINIYLPILPQLDGVFQTTRASVRLTVTVFLFGFSSSQLVWGSISDRFGRKPVLLIGLTISVIGAAIAAFSDSIFVFAGARLLESLGLGAAPVLARSMLTDELDRAHVAIAMAYAAITVAVVPAFAPIVGGYLDLLFTWRAVFLFLVVYGGTIAVLCLLSLPETNRKLNLSVKASQVVAAYKEILSNRRYVGFITAYGIGFGTLIGFYAAAPFIFVKDLGYASHEYGFLLIVNAASYVLGVTVSRFAVPRVGTDRPIALALIAYAAATIGFFVLDSTTTMNTASVLLPMSLFVFGAGMVSPAANAGALTIFKDKAGSAAALVGFSMAMGGAVFSAVVSAVHITRLWQLGVYVGVSTLLSAAVYLALLRPRTVAAAVRQTD